MGIDIRNLYEKYRPKAEEAVKRVSGIAGYASKISPLLSYLNNHLAIYATGLLTRFEKLGNGDLKKALLTTPAIMAGMRAGYQISDWVSSNYHMPEKVVDALMALIGYNAAKYIINKLDEMHVFDRIYNAADRILGKMKPEINIRNLPLAIILTPLIYPFAREFNDFMSAGESVAVLNALTSLGAGYFIADKASRIARWMKNKAMGFGKQ